MTVTESQSEFSLWSAEAAPLIAGTDIANLAAQNLSIYENRDVIAVDQDPLGAQASVVSNANSQWMLVKPLADGAKAVVLFNAADTPWTNATASLSSLGVGANQRYLARDLWTHAETTVTTGLHIASLPAHGSVMLRLSSPDALINDQMTAVGSAGGGSFAAQLGVAKALLDHGATRAACLSLDAYVLHVKAQSGRQLTVSQAKALIAGAEQIEELIRC